MARTLRKMCTKLHYREKYLYNKRVYFKENCLVIMLHSVDVRCFLEVHANKGFNRIKNMDALEHMFEQLLIYVQ